MTDIEARWQAFLADPPDVTERAVTFDDVDEEYGGDDVVLKLAAKMTDMSESSFFAGWLRGLEEAVWRGVNASSGEWAAWFPERSPTDVTRDVMREAIMAAGGVFLPSELIAELRFGSVAQIRREVE